MIALPLLAAALTQAEPPRGVNDSIIGTAEQFRTIGPARVCLMQTTVDVAAGETAYLDYLGIHWGGVRIEGPNGTVHIREGDSWAVPQSSAWVYRDGKSRTVLRYRSRNGPRYLIFSRTDYSPDRERPTIWIEGDGLDGSSRDRGVVRRINYDTAEPRDCRRRFGYGWDMLLGEGEEGEQ